MRRLFFLFILLLISSPASAGDFKIVIGRVTPYSHVTAISDSHAFVTKADGVGFYVFQLSGVFEIEGNDGRYQRSLDTSDSLYPVIWMSEIGNPPVSDLQAAIRALQTVAGAK